MTDEEESLLELYLEGLREQVTEASPSPLLALAEQVPLPAPEDVAPGQLWAALPEGAGLGALVLILEAGDPAPCVLVSTEVEAATEDDVWVAADRSPLEEPLLICAWLVGEVARRSLRGLLGAGSATRRPIQVSSYPCGQIPEARAG